MNNLELVADHPWLRMRGKLAGVDQKLIRLRLRLFLLSFNKCTRAHIKQNVITLAHGGVDTEYKKMA
jgi:hypothetical protein